MYRVTSSRGDVTQESSKVSHRSTFGLSCNSSSLITFTCAQACVVSVLVTSSTQNSLPVLEVQASALAVVVASSSTPISTLTIRESGNYDGQSAL